MFGKFKKYFSEICTIAAPIIVGNLGHTLTGAVDVFVAAKYSIDALAAIAIANSIFFTVSFLGIGFLIAISIVLSNYRGAKMHTKRYFSSGVILSQVLALITWVLLVGITYFIPHFGFQEELVKDIQVYMYVTSFSVFGMYLFQGIKEFLLAHEIVNFPNYLLIASVLLNLVLNWILVFGWGFIPSMGVLGLSVATLIVRIVIGFAMVIYTWNMIKKSCHSPQIYDKEYVKSLMKVGFPIGVGFLVEFLGFNIVTMALGRQSALLAAAHNILITLVDAAFMIPLAISSSIAIKVGFFNGAKNFGEIKNFSLVGIFMCFSFMFVMSVLFAVMPDAFIGIFTHDKDLYNIALPVVSLFVFYEIVDGLQIALGGVLKGLKMTKQVTASVLSGYWFFGIPIGFYLAYAHSIPLEGFWIGLLIAATMIFVFELFFVLKRMSILKKEYS